MKFFRLFILFIAIITLPARAARADVVPTWTTPDGTSIDVPLGGSATFIATGNISSSFDALLLFDTSGSMEDSTGRRAPNGGLQRGDWAIAGAEGLIDRLDDSIRLGLVDFDTNASLVTPLMALGSVTADPSHRVVLKEAVNGLNRMGGTNIADAIRFAALELTNSAIESNSQHIVLVTDGMSDNGGSELTETANAIRIGIETVNTISLPGADREVLQRIADTGNGVFVNGSDLDTLIDGFSAILDSAEALDQLDITLPDGTTVMNILTTIDGDFMISGDVFEGNNIFQVRATSTLGNIATADLIVTGIAVPEPNSGVLLALAVTSFMMARKRQPAKSP